MGNSGFEVFTGRAVATPHPPFYATFQKRGLLTLNRAAFQALGEPEAVELLYNRDTRSMGIRPTGLGHSWSYKLRREARSGMFKLSVAAFRRHYGLPEVTVAKRYRATQRDDMLVIDLNQEPVITGREPTPMSLSSRCVAVAATRTSRIRKRPIGGHRISVQS